MGFTKQLSDTVAADPGVIYDILCDYDSYAEWMPLIGSGKLLAIEGDLAIAEFGVTDPKGSVLQVECIHDRDRRVKTRRINGELPFQSMTWDIESAGSGSKVTLSIECEWSAKWLTPNYSSVPKNAMAGLKRQAAAAVVSVQGPGGDTLLEVMETEEGLVCVLNGKKYVMREA
jgi:ribosome-associated toxin RatA of RatAB toxin-antitoxin module